MDVIKSESECLETTIDEIKIGKIDPMTDAKFIFRVAKASCARKKKTNKTLNFHPLVGQSYCVSDACSTASSIHEPTFTPRGVHEQVLFTPRGSPTLPPTTLPHP